MAPLKQKPFEQSTAHSCTRAVGSSPLLSLSTNGSQGWGEGTLWGKVEGGRLGELGWVDIEVLGVVPEEALALPRSQGYPLILVLTLIKALGRGIPEFGEPHTKLVYF